MANEKNLKKFSSTYQPKKNGRPKKLVSTLNEELKAEGYEEVTDGQVRECFKTMFNLPLSKLSTIAKKESDYPLLYKLIAKELLGKAGSNQLEKMLDRAFGKAKQSQDITSDGDKITGIDIVFLDASKDDD